MDFDNKQAVVTVEQATYDERKLLQAVEDAGFGASVKKSAPRGGGTQRPEAGKSLGPVQQRGVTYSSRSFSEHAQVSAYLDQDVLRPADSFRVAVVFDIEEGWHIYGNPLGPGIGQKTVIWAEAPAGFHFERARYARARRVDQDFGEVGKTWVWEHTDKTIHYVSGTVGDGVKPGQYEWTVQASAQVCTATTCLPGKVTIRLPVTVVAKGSPAESINSELFDGFTAAKAPAEQSGT